MDSPYYWESFSLIQANEQICLNREGVGVTIVSDDPQSLPEGNMSITNLNIVWKPPPNFDISHVIKTSRESVPSESWTNSQLALFIPLSNIVFMEKSESVYNIANRNTTVPEIILHCNGNCVVKLSFGLSGQVDFFHELQKQLLNKCWLLTPSQPFSDSRLNRILPLGPKSGGISGIEKRRALEGEFIDDNISKAFLDLDSLQRRAWETVKLCRQISKEMNEKVGILNDDEVALFKSHLLSMGLESDKINSAPAPAKVNGNKSLPASHKLAREIISLILPLLVSDKTTRREGSHSEDDGYSHKASIYQGFMTLPEAYCRINRAKTYDMISPEDMLKACNHINVLNSEGEEIPASEGKNHRVVNEKLRFKDFENGLLILCLDSLLHFHGTKLTDLRGGGTNEHSKNLDKIREAMHIMEEKNKSISTNESITYSNPCSSISAEEMARIYYIPVFIAKEQLLIAEGIGELCRDDSVEGTRFYDNFFARPHTPELY